MAQGVLGHPATVTGWETATRGGQKEGEGQTWSYREVQAVRISYEPCPPW
jgi:hypothetical protein